MKTYGIASGAYGDCEGSGSPLVLTGSVRPCVVRRGVFRRFTGETYVPTKQSSSCKEARLSRPYGYGRRSSCAQGSSGQGPRQAERVTTVAAGRLIGRSSFAALSARGVRVRSTVLSAKVLVTKNPPRIGFALPTSLGNAVARNRIKRQLRAALSLSPLPQSSVDVVIRPSAKAMDLGYHQLMTDLQLLLLRVDQLAVPA
jgi:ribonuclease P protein component